MRYNKGKILAVPEDGMQSGHHTVGILLSEANGSAQTQLPSPQMQHTSRTQFTEECLSQSTQGRPEMTREPLLTFPGHLFFSPCKHSTFPASSPGAGQALCRSTRQPGGALLSQPTPSPNFSLSCLRWNNFFLQQKKWNTGCSHTLSFIILLGLSSSSGLQSPCPSWGNREVHSFGPTGAGLQELGGQVTT